MMEVFKIRPTGNAKITENRNNMLKIVKRILEFNQLNQSGQGLKILTPSQMLNRLPISLAQFKAGNSSENLKTKLSNYCILCAYQKNLQTKSIKVWLTLFKNENNLYEHQKQ